MIEIICIIVSTVAIVTTAIIAIINQKLTATKSKLEMDKMSLEIGKMRGFDAVPHMKNSRQSCEMIYKKSFSFTMMQIAVIVLFIIFPCVILISYFLQPVRSGYIELLYYFVMASGLIFVFGLLFLNELMISNRITKSLLHKLIESAD